MLHVPAPFPHAGSEAFVAPDGARARILRDNGDGTCLIALTEIGSPVALESRASGNRTEPKENLFASVRAALEAGKRRGRGGAYAEHDGGTPRQSRKARRPARPRAPKQPPAVAPHGDPAPKQPPAVAPHGQRP